MIDCPSHATLLKHDNGNRATKQPPEAGVGVTESSTKTQTLATCLAPAGYVLQDQWKPHLLWFDFGI